VTPSPPTSAAEAAALDGRILALIGRGEGAPRDDAAFAALARDLFAHQYARNAPYRRLCEADGVAPDPALPLERIPACPTEAFKRHVLTTFPPDRAVVGFRSSGTTGQVPGRHLLPTLALYHAALRASFDWYVQPDGRCSRTLVLFPAPEAAPDSSLGAMLARVAPPGAPGGAWLVPDPVDVAPAHAVLAAAQAAGEPIAVLGTAFSFVHLCDGLEALGPDVRLPRGSRVMETGGYKGRSREVARDQLYAMLTRRLGVPDAMIVNEYGMTEMGSQCYDGTLRAALGLPGRADRVKRAPPWLRSWVVDPADPTREVADGAIGILKHLDLVNRGSVCCLLTGDRARRAGDGFELLGRAAGAELRGCSLRLEQLEGGPARIASRREDGGAGPQAPRSGGGQRSGPPPAGSTGR
jgi:hypothetical protein